MRFQTEEALRKFIARNKLRVTEEITDRRGIRVNVVGGCTLRPRSEEPVQLPYAARTLCVNKVVPHGTPVSRRVLKRSLTPQDR